MKNCLYCSSLLKATEGHNYCSKHQPGADAIKTNAFYLSSRQMHSGVHLSRWTIRSVIKGQQFYKSGNSDHLITPNNYLFIPEGQTYFSVIDAQQEVEALVVAFQADFIAATIYELTHSERELADQPFGNDDNVPPFLESLYSGTRDLQKQFLQIKECILNSTDSSIRLEELYYQLLRSALHNHRDFIGQSEKIPAKKKSVREELFKRLAIGKDYIHAHLTESLELSDLSQVSLLSPFHFLRLFKSLYGCTPHQYITTERLKHATTLLKKPDLNIQAVAERSGFNNHSSFSRLFKSHIGLSPSEFRDSAYKPAEVLNNIQL